jgi:uncharacterized protein (DUF736 family)
MTIIARLTKQEDGRFKGTLSTLALHAANITIVPEAESDNEKAPGLRVYANGFELGAGWKKTSKAGNRYWSVKLDDPSFAQPIYCVFVKVGDAYQLEWNRQTPRRSSRNESAEETVF